MATFSFQRVLVWDILPGGTVRTLRNGTVTVKSAADDSTLFNVTSDQNGLATFTTTDVATVYLVSPNGLVSDHITAASILESAAAAALNNDAGVASFVSDTGSATRGALDATYGTKAQQDANTAAVATKAEADAVPTLEEVQHSATLTSATITVASTIPVLTALYDCTLEQVSFAFRANVAASDSAYWSVGLVRYRNGSATTIAIKTTKVTGGAGITAWSDWNFDTTVIGGARALTKGDILTVALTPVGSPAALDGPVITMRTLPGTTTVTPVAAVSDTFTRANSTTSLGTADTGQVWAAAPTTAWGIASNQAYCTDLTAGRKWALIDAGFADCTVSMKLAAVGATSYPGLAWRCDTADNGFTTDRSNVYRDDAGTLTSIATFPPLNPGDTISVTCSGAQHTVKVNGVVVATVTDTKNQSVARHGMRVSAATGSDGHRLDDFKVTV